MAVADTTRITPPLREAPATPPLGHKQGDRAHPDVSKSKNPEPRLAVEQIQGNIIPGFLKDYETLLFLKIDNVADCKLWLHDLLPFIATAEEVLAFNRLFKAIRVRRGRESTAIKATWINLAFSYSALAVLTAGTPNDVKKKDFLDTSFKSGLAARSSVLGDPSDQGAEGNPKNWVVGGSHNEADIVLIVQSDDRDDLFDHVEQLEDSIYAFQHEGKFAPSGVQIVYKEHGANLSGSLSGHEHFGFLDGVSQPGIRGYVSDDPTDVLTPRQNPRDDNQGKPGQDLLWPGTFIFGYQGQNAAKAVDEPGNVVHAGPDWADNGSYMVFRRLRQDVGGFHAFIHGSANSLNMSPTMLGSRIVGRWPSGSPVLRDPVDDNASLGGNDCANNDFEFFHEDPSISNGKDAPPDGIPPFGNDSQCAISAHPFPASPGDKGEVRCPAFGHIRKAYPRDDITPAGAGGANDEEKSEKSEENTQTHRLLRRGLPFGPPSRSTLDAPISDDVDRGLLFVAYQTSIQGQFEFVTQRWVNNPDFKDKGAGFDLVIGQNSAGNRERVAKLTVAGADKTLTADKDWVIPTGGGYFFAPSLDALGKLSS